MKGVVKAPDGKRPHPPRMSKTEGKHQKAGGREILLRHEGLAPVRYSKKARPRIGLFQRANSLPDVGSIGLSFPRGSGPPVA
jgi:hypothetical protein